MELSSTISLDKGAPFFWNLAEQYLHVTDTTYQVLEMKGNTIFLKENDEDSSRWYVKLLKIISLATVILPSLAFVVKVLYRSQYSYKVIYSSVKVQKEIDTWKKVFEKQASKEGNRQQYSLFKRPAVSESPPEMTLLEQALSSKERFVQSYEQINQLAAASLNHLMTHRDSKEALSTAKSIYKKLSNFLRNSAKKELFRLYSSNASDINLWAWSDLVDHSKSLKLSTHDFITLWYLLRGLRKQIKYIGKHEKLKTKIKPEQVEGLAFCGLSWIHGTKASVLKSSCEQTSQKILPSGKLQQKKVPILTGEMAWGATADGINITTISGTGLHKGDMALRYAKDHAFDLDKDMNSYANLLERRVSFVAELPPRIRYEAFLDQGFFTYKVLAVQHIHDYKNDVFQKDLGEWKKLMQILKSEMHQYIFLEKPDAIFL